MLLARKRVWLDPLEKGSSNPTRTGFFPEGMLGRRRKPGSSETIGWVAGGAGGSSVVGATGVTGFGGAAVWQPASAAIASAAAMAQIGRSSFMQSLKPNAEYLETRLFRTLKNRKRKTASRPAFM
jgi:hypothetical protein